MGTLRKNNWIKYDTWNIATAISTFFYILNKIWQYLHLFDILNKCYSYYFFMGLIFADILAIIIAIFSVLFITLEFYVGIIGRIKGAPFVASKPNRIQTMIELANICKDMRVVDLGSGDGSIVIAAARAGAIASGVEMNPFLIPYSRWRARRAGVQERTTFVRGEIKDFPLHDADVVFLYLLPNLLRNISKKLSSELKPDAYVISNAFPIPEWTPVQEKNGVFVYRIEKT